MLDLLLELRVSFSMFDKDGDGQITAEEVMETMKSIGIKFDSKEVKTMVKLVDIDGRMDDHPAQCLGLSFLNNNLSILGFEYFLLRLLLKYNIVSNL